jgi:hypothetical protein
MNEGFNRLIALPKFVEHKIASSETEAVTAAMYEYLMAAGGVFIRARRREFTACLPFCERKINSLPDVKSGIVWHKPKISKLLWRHILEHARANSDDGGNFREDVYVVYWNESYRDWTWKPVSRERSLASTLAEDRLTEYGEACIELHTHPPGAIHFSGADDRDERGKFRIFGILIDVHSAAPKIRFRCGIYDFFAQIPAFYVSEMPQEIIDLNAVEARLRKILQ